jgi:Rad3-related DNA helicase
MALTTTLLPVDLSLPPKFSQWRPGQWECVDTTTATDKRFVAAAIPTGGGKSLYGVASALLLGGRCIYVTSSKALQDQLREDFASCGMVDMRGRSNYHCSQVHGSCSEGRILECRALSCAYQSARAEFSEAPLALTNYAYYLSSVIHSEGVGDMDTLILDEAHSAVQELSNAIEIHVPHFQFDRIYNTLNTRPPYQSNTLAEWRTWAKITAQKAAEYLAQVKRKRDTRNLGLADHFHSTVSRLAEVPESWILDKSNSAETVIAPLWPTEYASYLFGNAGKVILSSATLVPKTLELLGVPESEYIFLSQDNVFPKHKAPVYVFGRTRVDHKMSNGDWQQVVGCVDTFIKNRLDRKGIIHTVSYTLQERLLRDSEHNHLMIAPKNSKEFSASLEEFRRSPSPAIFVSPAATTGYDFPGKQCEYQVLLKLPFIDTRGPIMKARTEKDPEYASYLTAQTLVQTCGRGMRSSQDQCENFIVDAHARWFFQPKEKRGCRHLLPGWFTKQIQYTDYQPEPLQPLPED